MSKIEQDKYYTPKELSKILIQKTFEVLKLYGVDDITQIVQPSAGNGSFSNQIQNCIAYDIQPQNENIKKADFLQELIFYKSGRLCIGNPPFGRSNNLSIKFYKKCCQIGDYIAFIQPISQLNNNLQMYEFDLIYSQDLGILDYSGVSLHCCFNVYIRPKNGKLNKKPDYRLKDVTIIEHRRKKGEYSTGKNKPISSDYDFAFCNWGNGSFGKKPQFVGQYAQQVYVYVHNKQYLDRIGQLLQYENIRKFAQSISSKRMSVMRIYKYLKDNIEGII